MESARPEVAGEGSVVGAAPVSETRRVQPLDLEDQGDHVNAEKERRRDPEAPEGAGRERMVG